jgi:hypothetical protein
MVSVTPRTRFTPGERTPGTHWIGGWVGPRAGLDAGNTDLTKIKHLIQKNKVNISQKFGNNIRKEGMST